MQSNTIIQDHQDTVARRPAPLLPAIPEAVSEVREALWQEGYVKYAELYREHADQLREIAESPAHSFSTEARRLLRQLLLEQTLPFGELEADPDVDSYTGEPIDNLEPSDGARSAAEYGHTPFVVANSWEQYVLQREPYGDPQLNKLFIEANTGPVGLPVERDEPPLEDRGYIPDSFLPDISTDDHLKDLRAQFEPVSEALSDRISREIDQHQSAGRGLQARKCRYVVRHSEESKAALRFLQDRLDEGANVANVARLFLRFQHGLCWNWTDAKWLELCHEGSYRSLLEWLNMFEDEMLEFWDPAPPIKATTIEQVDAFADQLMEEYYQSLPLRAPNPRNTRGWIRGYLEGIISGLPIRRKDEQSYTAIDAAWDTWRHSISPKAASAFKRAITEGASHQQANGRFYRVAKEQGVQFPKRRAKIKAISRDGLRLSSGRFVSWWIARIKLEENELDLEKEDRSRLKSILATKGWGSTFASAL